MKLVLRLLLTAFAFIILDRILPGVTVNSYTTAIIAAIVLGLLNYLVKPLLILLTLPVTILTLGLFLLIINAIIIILASKLINGFTVDNIWWAIIFSLLLSLLQSVLFSLLKEDE